jgi:Cu-Zn family superoxide dismutase
MKYVFLAVLIILSACASREEKEEKLTKVAESMKVASAEIHSTTMKDVKGTVTFEEKPESLMVMADISGLKKDAKLGFHIHENGICEGPDYKTAGNHFNPHMAKHGSPDTDKSHAGDMGNIQTDKDGHASSVVNLKGVTLTEVMGKAVLIHAKTDDLKTQPSGNSGGKIACGLIRPVQ